MSAPVMMIHLQDRVMVFGSGHSVEFKNRQPTAVPAICVEEAMERGAAPANHDDLPVQAPPEDRHGPAVGLERTEAVLRAIKALVERNSADDFDANGNPRLPALTEEAGFKIDAAERSKLWKRFKETNSGDA